MATLVLQTAGSLIGGLVGGPVGAAVGAAIGGSIGAAADATLLSTAASGRGGRKITHGPRLKDLDGISATEGAPIPRLYGRARLGGQVIWATRMEEEAVYSVTRARGGKGGTARAKASVDVSFRYYANVAIGLCEGPVAFVRRVWADGKPVDLTEITMRVHRGAEDQPADPLIVAKQGAGGAPAYRGLAYVVFERLPLEAYGNRLPQFSFEVVRPVHGLCRRVRAVNLIPGAGEYVYEPTPVSAVTGLGASRQLNRAQLTHRTNWHASIDALQALCPNLEHVALVVSWFGDDLRAGECLVQPLTEPGAPDGVGQPWSVAGLVRGVAGTVSAPNGIPAYGGTPTDGSVMRAIRDLKERGLKVTAYPFLMMDVPPDNEREDPRTGAPAQPPYPWRGRITCDPAPGREGSPDETAEADAQVGRFMGSCAAAHFAVGPDSVSYAGPTEWTLRRLVLHTAALAQAAGGVDAIAIGSELVSLTRVRGAGAVNPAVAGLKALAAEVRALVGAGTKIVYGADWTEYGAESRDGGGELRFPLDPLWADGNIDAVAIDWYPPVTDWRDGVGHLDAALYDGPYDARLFRDRMASGEAFDWYYADDAGRAAQTRLPIADGAYAKPWVFRPKDLASWWANEHVERIGGLETAATAWVPGGKPIWLLELGCPAVDRGANGPNVFPDPKSAEGGLPPISRGMRDDLVQARAVVAALDHFDPTAEGFDPAANPAATLYDGRMVDPSRIYLWTWDARPFPAFPTHGALWADAGNFQSGHWLNGRIEGAPMDDLLAALLADYGAAAPAELAADGFVDGYVLDRPMAARAAIEPLAEAFSFDAVVSAGSLRFRRRGARAVATLEAAQLAAEGEGDRPARGRAQDSELPSALTLGFVDPDADYRQGAARAAIAGASEGQEAAVSIAAAMGRAVAIHRAEVMLAEARAARETVAFALPPSRLDLEPGDAVTLEGRPYRLTRIGDGRVRRVEAVAVETAIHLGAPRATPIQPLPPPPLPGPPLAIVLDLAVAESETPPLQRLAVAADPWPGAYTLFRSENGGASFAAVQRIARRATVGALAAALPAGPLWRIDHAASFELDLSHGALQSVGDLALLGGANLIAVETAGLGWEILGYGDAELVGPRRWRLSRLLRGLAGSEPCAAAAKPVGARAVILDGGVAELVSGLEWLQRPALYRLAPEGRDHADPMAATFTATAGPAALLPLAPVHPRARREAGGVRLSWIRRTRYGGDNWELAEAPLNEADEAYRIEILDGATVKRTLAAASPEAFYAAADETADFGGPQASLSVRVAQMSATVGAGHPAAAVLTVG